MIRQARDEDGPDIAKLIETVFAEYPGCPFVLAEFPELIRPFTHYSAKGGGLWVLVPKDNPLQVVGSFGLSRVDASPMFELHKVYLAADQRGTGWTDRLFAIALEAIIANGGTSIRLWSDIRFERAHRYYTRRGFEKRPITRYLADATQAWEYAFTAPVETVAAHLSGIQRA